MAREGKSYRDRRSIESVVKGSMTTDTRGIFTSTKEGRTTTRPVSLIASKNGGRYVCVFPKNRNSQLHLARTAYPSQMRAREGDLILDPALTTTCGYHPNYGGNPSGRPSGEPRPWILGASRYTATSMALQSKHIGQLVAKGGRYFRSDARDNCWFLSRSRAASLCPWVLRSCFWPSVEECKQNVVFNLA